MSNKPRGKFITLEGSEGVGKSTNMAVIKEWLEDNNIDYVATREPGGTPLSEEIRQLLLSPREEKVDATAELLLVFSARAQHINTFIKPHLERGTWVLSDRFTDATFAYQGYGRGLDLALIEQLEQTVQQGLQPDLTVYLDVDVKVGLERARARGELDRFEQEAIDFFEKVRQGYLARVNQSPARFAVVDAGQSIEKVGLDAKAQLTKHLGA